MVRHAECIVPNMFIIPSIREPGTKPKRKGRGTELSWAMPIDNEHVRGLSIVAWPLENGEPKPDWKPGTDTIADIRPGSFLKRSYEQRQRNPDDLEAQEGQRRVAIHALENLAHSDTGIVILQRLLREQFQRIEQGLDPINTARAPSANKRIPQSRTRHLIGNLEAEPLENGELQAKTAFLAYRSYLETGACGNRSQRLVLPLSGRSLQATQRYERCLSRLLRFAANI
jgi:hypothetical protein